MNKRKRKKNKAAPKQKTAEGAAKIEPPKAVDDPNWDRVDEAGWESFPASDPPGHY